MNVDSCDISFTSLGDFTVGKNGDLGDTEDDVLESFRNDIRDIVKSEFGDWEKDATLGGNLSDFLGLPNTRQTAIDIQDRIKSRIVSTGLIASSDITVRVVPVHIHQIMLVITASVNSTPLNGLSPGEPVIISMLYDTIEQGTFVELPNMSETNSIKG